MSDKLVLIGIKSPEQALKCSNSLALLPTVLLMLDVGFKLFHPYEYITSYEKKKRVQIKEGGHLTPWTPPISALILIKFLWINKMHSTKYMSLT